MNELSVIKILDYEKDGAFCTLLKYNKVNILLDCGLNESFDLQNYKEQDELLNDIDIILISSSELQYCGGLIYLARKYNYFSNIYCTLPVKYMINSNLIIKLLYLNEGSQKINKINFFQNTEIIINRIQDIKYQEDKVSKIKDSKIRFQALPKGNSFGSCAYKLQIDDKRFMYLIDYSIYKSQLTISLDTEYYFRQKVDYLLTQVFQQPKIYNDLDKLFTNIIDNMLDSKSNIRTQFVVFNQTGRIFEYIFVLNKIMIQKNIQIKIYLPKIYDYCLDVIKRLTEFMSCNISQNFSFQDDNIFNFKTLSLISNIKIDRNHQQIILGSYQDFEYGQFKNFLNKFSDNKSQINYIELQESKGQKKNKENFFQEIIELKEDGFQNDQNINDSQIEDDLTTLETFNDIINRKMDKDFEIEDNDVQEDINEEKFMHWNFFIEKNDFISFKQQDIEIEQTEYGLTLDQEEKKNFNVNNFENVIIEKDQNDFQNFSIQREEFYQTYIDFILVNDIKLDNQRQQVIQLDVTQQKDFLINQKIFLENMNIKNEILLLNSNVENFNNMKVVTIDKTFTDYKEPVFKTILLDPNFQQLELINYDNHLRYQYIKFQFDKDQNNNINIRLVEQEQKQYQIFSSKYLLKIQEYLEQNGYNFDIRFNHINYKDKILLIKRKDNYLLEGKYSFEYFKVRQLLYKFNLGEHLITSNNQLNIHQYLQFIFLIIKLNVLIKF